MISLIFVGCSEKDDTLDRVMELRNNIITADGCSFTAVITADYTKEIYSFTMNCIADEKGNLSFDVIAPNAISGITGQFSEERSDLTFDGHVLAFPRLADGQLTPISAPWIFLETLRSGYIFGYSADKDETQFMINNTYEDNTLELSVWLDEQNLPMHVEIASQGKKVLTLKIEEFSVL